MVTHWSKAGSSLKLPQMSYNPCLGELFLPLPLDQNKNTHSLQSCSQPSFDYGLKPTQWMTVWRERNNLSPR